MYVEALVNPRKFRFLQNCPSYSGHLQPETPGDSKHTFLHCEDVLALA